MAEFPTQALSQEPLPKISLRMQGSEEDDMLDLSEMLGYT